MPTFTYTAVNSANDVTTGSLEATDKAVAIANLARQSLRPIKVKEGTPKSGALSIGSLLGGRKVKSDHLVMFTRQLSAMVSAGVPILRALASLQQHSESAGLKKVLKSVIGDVQGGAALADALGKFPETFNDVYVNMVRAGEAAGILDDILKRLALQQEKAATIRKKIKSAMTYPMVLVVITVGAFFGLMLFVVPQIGNIVRDLGGPEAKLPLLTEVLLAISDFMVKWWYILIPIMVAGIIFVLRYIKTPVGKRQFHFLTLKIPGVKGIVMKVAIARFARTFSALMGAGVPILESLNVTSRAVGNIAYEEALQAAAESVRSGANLSNIIDKNPLFPSIVAQMLSVGEETGQTDTVLIKVADFYEEEVDAAIEGVSSIIEPVMILMMGAVVGVVAAGVLGPISNMVNTIK